MDSEEQRQYPIVTRADEYPDGSPAWIAEHPDLPGCSAHASTEEEARARLGQARRAYIAHLQATGRPVPAPGSVVALRTFWPDPSPTLAETVWSITPISATVPSTFGGRELVLQ